MGRNRLEWKRIIQDNFTLSEGYEVLVNGRSIKSLESFETRIHDGDEIVFAVVLVGKSVREADFEELSRVAR